MSEHNNNQLSEDIKVEEAIDVHANIQETLTSLFKLDPGNENLQSLKGLIRNFGSMPQISQLIHAKLEKMHSQVKDTQDQWKRKASKLHQNMIAQLEIRERKYDV